MATKISNNFTIYQTMLSRTLLKMVFFSQVGTWGFPGRYLKSPPKHPYSSLIWIHFFRGTLGPLRKRCRRNVQALARMGEVWYVTVVWNLLWWVSKIPYFQGAHDVKWSGRKLHLLILPKLLKQVFGPPSHSKFKPLDHTCGLHQPCSDDDATNITLATRAE